MKKLSLAAGIITLLLIDWAALDDITTGREPSHLEEYVVLGLSVVLFGSLAWIGHRRGNRGTGA